jgi:hypothetical protein
MTARTFAIGHGWTRKVVPTGERRRDRAEGALGYGGRVGVRACVQAGRRGDCFQARHRALPLGPVLRLDKEPGECRCAAGAQ